MRGNIVFAKRNIVWLIAKLGGVFLHLVCHYICFERYANVVSR